MSVKSFGAILVLALLALLQALQLQSLGHPRLLTLLPPELPPLCAPEPDSRLDRLELTVDDIIRGLNFLLQQNALSAQQRNALTNPVRAAVRAKAELLRLEAHAALERNTLMTQGVRLAELLTPAQLQFMLNSARSAP